MIFWLRIALAGHSVRDYSGIWGGAFLISKSMKTLVSRRWRSSLHHWSAESAKAGLTINDVILSCVSLA